MRFESLEDRRLLTAVQTIFPFSTANTDGQAPLGALVQVGSTLYGTTSAGGTGGDGTIFSVNTDGTNFQLLHTFTDTVSDGKTPDAGLTLIGSTLYGTTFEGGSVNDGTIFSINTSGSGFQVIHSFTDSTTDGAGPEAALTVVGSALFGTTREGGSVNKGTIFSINASGSGFHVVHSFTDSTTDGETSLPQSALTLVGSTLFGTTTFGGADDNGTLYSMSTSGAGFQVLHSFTSTDSAQGIRPEAGVIAVGSTLFGSTEFGGTLAGGGFGTLYSISTTGSNFKILHTFTGQPTDGANPVGGFTLDGSTLFGTTNIGGTDDDGTIFSINTGGTGYQQLHSFSNTDGEFPKATMTLDGSTLFGTTLQGGSGLGGTIFSTSTIPQPQIAVTGGGQPIADQAATPSTTNDTTFPTTAVGSSSSETYTITNSGGAALTVGTVTIFGTNAADFSITKQPATSVAPGGSTTFTVKFTPSAAGSRLAAVSFTENDSTAASPFQFAVNGVASAPTIAVTGNSKPIASGSTTPSATNDTSFATTAVGKSSTETYTITNSGAAALNVGTVTITGTNAADFSVTKQPATSVAVGGTTTFTVTFTPSAAGTRSAAVSFTENDPTVTSPFKFAINGVASAPTIAVTGNAKPIANGSTTPSATNNTAFGSTAVGSSLSETYTITNSGTAPLAVGTVTISGANAADFSVTKQPATSVAVGASTTFTVKFTPSAAGTRSVKLSFTENDPAAISPFTFAISGTAPAPTIAVTGNSQPITDGSTTPSVTNDTAFANTAIGSSLSETYTITNNGTAALTVGTVTISGTNAADFSITTQPATSVAVGGSTTFTVKFTPSAGGTRSAKLSFTENDPSQTNPFTFAVSGVGAGPGIAVSGNSNPIADGSTTPSTTNDTAFGNTAVGSSLSETYTISNSGTAPLNVGTVTIGGTNAADFSVTSQPATSVAVGASTTFTVKFTPSAVGTRAATISFSENDPSQTSPFTFAVNGSAPAPSIAVTGNSKPIADGSTTPSTTNDTAFANTGLGSSSSQTYTITNNGTAPLTVGTVTIGGANAADFSVTSQPATSVAVGDSTTFTVKFTPSVLGARAATISFTENDSSQTSPFTFAVNGTAVVASASLSGTVFDDANHNGLFDSGETPLSNVTITLTGTDSGGTAIPQQTTHSSSTGTYSFSGLAAGTYSLAATMPATLTPGVASVSNGNGTPSGETITGINVVAGAADTGYNFSAFGLGPQFINVNTFLSSSSPSQLLNQSSTSTPAAVPAVNSSFAVASPASLSQPAASNPMAATPTSVVDKALASEDHWT